MKETEERYFIVNTSWSFKFICLLDVISWTMGLKFLAGDLSRSLMASYEPATDNNTCDVQFWVGL